MVFESIVTELVNKYLGDFIENLDKSQLKIGLWGGDVVLNNLYVKESALDELDLPVKVLHGNIGKLVLKVPWKNLYTEPTVATLEGLYVVAVPNAGVKYNAEKEAKADWEKKQKELVRIEEAKRQEDEKDQKKEEKADTFAEKLASNVIKNLQVNVSDIHIRYEDHYTNPKRPFSLGVTLKSLTFQTTDENWHPKTIKEAVTMIYKVVQLQSLAVYWNPNTPSFLKQEREKILDTMKGSIASPNNKTSLPYLIEPISSSAKLTMHTKPEKDQFSIPKILLNVLFEEIAICLTRHQYHDVMELLEALERMNLSSMYRKYDRPQTPIKGGSKHWWHFAYRCVLGETVRRRRQMWSWDHIKAHRDRCRKYKELYKKKLLTKKPGSDLEKQLENLEKDLSIFSITLVRQQADMETKDKRVKQESKGGWFGGWFGGGKKKEKKEEEDIAGQFQKAMSNEEKAKLYSAIGYQENQLDPTLPKDYVAHKLGFKLNKLSLKLKDTDRGEPQVVDVQLVDVFANVAQRPAASAVRIETKMDTLTVFGCPVSTGSKVPNLVTSQNQGSPYSLLDMLIETNPLDGKCDQRVSLNARPLEIAYDAHTINQVTAFFKPPEAVYLKQIQAAALAKFEELKEQSATGLKHTIEQHKFTDISVDIQPSYVILPDKGIYRSDATMLVLDLGSLKVSSEKQEVSATTPQGEQIDLEEMLSKAFDKFNVRLEQIQLLFVRPGEDWKAARKTISNMHILKPMALDINIFKSMIEDSRMPKMKVHGELPNLSINMSDARLKEILDLIQSIPFPESEPPPPEQDMDWDAPDIQAVALEVPGDTSRVLQKVQAAVEGDSGSDSEGEKKAALKTQKSQEYVNMTDLEARFELKEICLSLSQVKDNVEVPTLKIVVNSLGTEVKIRTFDMNAAAYLGGIYIQYQQLKALNDGPLINLVNTPADETMAQLLYVEYTKANIKGPEFTTTYKNTEQKLNVHFSALEILLHQEAILELLSLAHKLQPAPAAAAPAVEPPASIEAPITTTDAAKLQSKPLIKRRKGKQEIEIIDLAVTAKLDVFQVNICTQHAPITDIRVKGFEANVEMMKSKLAVQASLKDLAIIDPTPEAIYSKILSFEGGDVFKVGFTQYNGATEGEHYADLSRVDMRVEADFGCMKVVFLNKFVNNLLNFLNNFQVAMDALKEASVSAAEQAAQAAQQVAQNASRLGLNINMKAPVIVIPQSSVSHNALMADLGFLSIKNNFTAESAKNEKGQPAVLDNLSVELVSLKVMRAELHAGTGNKECLLIHPVTVRVNITRNLSATWYHGVPEINISGHLEAFSVCMSQGDFGLIMKVLNENLTEGATPPPAPAAAQPAVEGAVKAETATTVQASAEGEIVPAQADVVQAAPGVATGVYSKMKFSFRLETINATLYSGDSDLKSGSTSERETKNSLAKFDMKTIAVEGEMKTDNSMSAKVILHNIVLDDTRPSRADGITKMIERSQRDLSFEHMTNMIDVEFKQDDKMNKNGVVKVNSLYICVCLDFLMQLGDFFTKGMADSQPPAAPATPAVTETTGTSAGAMEPVKPAAAEPAKPPEGEFVLSLSVEHPEIIMVENSKDLNTKALILDTQVKAKVRISPEQQQISGEVADLRIYSCQFSTLQEGTKTMILHPCTISLHSNAPFGKGQHVDINLTDIVMDITPATIRQITATLSSLSPQPEEGTVDHLAGIPKKLWDIQKLEECNFQFLQTEPEPSPIDVRDQQAVGLKDEVVPVEPRGEQLLMAINKITVKLEGGVGTRTLPLLIVEMGFKAEVKDWSTKLYVSSDIHMEVAYYNEKLAVWEPVLEPVQTERGASRPWELGIEVEANDELPPITDDDDTEVIITPPPKMTVTIQSQELLEITLTKSCLEVLGNLGKAFGDAYNLVEAPEKMDVALAPYAVRNDSGLSVSLRLDESFMPPTNSHEGIVQLMPGDLLDLNNAEQKVTTKAEKSVIKATQDKDRRTLMIMLEEFGVTRELHIMRAEQRVFQINQRTYGNETWALLCQTEVSYGRKTVSLRSILQVQNQLQVAMEVYYKLGNDAMGRCGEIDAGQMLNVPLEAVYAAPFELYFKPRGPQYQESSEPVTWKDMEAGSSTTLSCSPYKPGPQNFFFNVSLSMEDVFFEATGEKTAKSHMLTLKPCAVFYNLLPIPVSVLLEGCADEIEVAAGEKTVFLNAEMGKTHVEVRIMKYQGREWSGKRLLEDKFKELTVWTFESSEGTSKDSMDLGLHCVKDKGYHEWSLYCPYWIINKTGRLLSYKGTDESCVTQAADSTEALLFSFKSKSILGKKKGSVTDEDTMVKASTNSSPKKAAKAKKIKKKTMKASLKIDDSDWSDKFSLDTVGSAGIVSCKLKGAPQEVGVNITLASSGLTKIVVFTPYFLLVNQAQFAISCRENVDDAPWYDLEPGECKPYWQFVSGKKVQMLAKVKDTDVTTKPFMITQAHTTLLTLEHEYQCINVECTVMEATIHVTFDHFKPGMAAVCLVNHTSGTTLSYKQHGQGEFSKLGPQESVLYTWQDPLEKREFIWSAVEKKENKHDLVKDGIGDIFLDSDHKLYWVSFLDGMQRVILFTEDLALATIAQQAGELERIDMETILALKGLGLSLVNNYVRKEVAYLGITSSGVVWEEKKRRRFKALKAKHSRIIEAAWDKYQNQLIAGKASPGRIQLESKIELDFNTMQMFKPRKCTIRRSYENGIWLQYRQSPHQQQFHAKIHRLQLDSQMPGVIFQTVLSPIPPPKSVAAESVPKPFTEMSVMIRKRDHTTVLQFKYFKILTQEMALKVDQIFLNSIIEMFASGEVSEEQKKEAFDADTKMIDSKLVDEASKASATGQKHFYDDLHISPLKVHISFSMYSGGEEKKQAQLHSNVINLFLQSVGVVLSDVQDVVFKLGYFERKHSFYNQSQLVSEATVHYTGQAIKQMYVLVLGLDVLGNPFGVVRGLAEGIEDLFYEPYQGAIQGPEEFAEGLALGVRSLLGHAVGGAAGAVSRITGALGKGIATLTFDEDYQRKRREQLNKQPTGLKEGLAQGGKGLVMGVFDGVTGIVRKPVEGAKQEGVEGFFKGMGKGLVGVFTRPASGVVDFASTSFEGLRRTADMAGEVRRIRPPRYLQPDGIVRPYNHMEAEGNGILQDLEKGKYSLTDEYQGHVVVTKDGKNILLVTDLRVVFVNRGQIFGQWDCEWQYTWADLKEKPTTTSKGVQILLREKQKKSIFHSSTVGKLVPMDNKEAAEWIVGKMVDAMTKAK